MLFGPHIFDGCSSGESGDLLINVTSGELELSGPSGEWTIPINHMVFIPKDRPFRIVAKSPTTLRVIKFTQSEAIWDHDECWVGATSNFASQMLFHACGWNEKRTEIDNIADSFFVTLGFLLPGWFKNARIMWIPFGQTSEVQRAIMFARQYDGRLSISSAAQKVGMSERTLRRRFQQEIGQNWREFMQEMKMNQAMKLLRMQDRSITEIAFEIGFNSSSAFTYAFTSYVGLSPSNYAKQHSHPATDAGAHKTTSKSH